MYDAKLGRFLSPDNYIQEPFSTQSFNRYGYVWNNPLKFTDKSGELSLKGFLDFVYKAFKIIVSAAAVALITIAAIETGGFITTLFGTDSILGTFVGFISSLTTFSTLLYVGIKVEEFIDNNVHDFMNSLPDPNSNNQNTNLNKSFNGYNYFMNNKKPNIKKSTKQNYIKNLSLIVNNFKNKKNE
ncbi:RHS repeat domain-containing protein [Polaribacter cellanae]|uniref:RHS repeat-associated core domain-containing protein n=1 Tax=Polaribacter cellanae TaxID=2818493 RepID=A0A975H7C0_9FLAO|nr:RHS repeat-associated core domain-containing protein [Polaribacter cellanae]QTE23356.1 hypothetical protein J3359_03500 [Polaribacter cellanae]